MTDPQTAPQSTASAKTVEKGTGLLDQIVEASPDKSDETTSLLNGLLEASLRGTLRFDKTVSRTLRAAEAKLDELISKQLSAVLHNEQFLKVEGSWRGLKKLIDDSELGSDLKIEMFNATKQELYDDFDGEAEEENQNIRRLVYEQRLGTAGGEPLACLIGDYEFSKSDGNDMELLGKIAEVSMEAFCPFLSAASPDMFGKKSFPELSDGKPLDRVFDGPDSAKWRNFRKRPEASFVALTMPRVLARVPYGAKTKSIRSFPFEETSDRGWTSADDEHEARAAAEARGEVPTQEDESRALDHAHYCWTNSAYVLGTKLTQAFRDTGWTTAIRGARGGGKVDDLPTHVFKTDDGDLDVKCPTEVAITDRRDYELAKLGFVPLCHYKNQDYAVFFSGQTTQDPTAYDTDLATANAKITARLPYVMAVSRFAHYLKAMGRDMIGMYMSREDCELKLQRWIERYVNETEGAGQEMRARYPLRHAVVSVEEVAGSPGEYAATAWLQPWLQLEKLTTSMRLVAKIPNQRS